MKTKNQKRKSTKNFTKEAEEAIEVVDEEIRESHVSMTTTEITKIDKNIDHCLEIYLKKQPTTSA